MSYPPISAYRISLKDFHRPYRKDLRIIWHAIMTCGTSHPHPGSPGGSSMATRRVTPLWNYLHEASNPSLESFELSRLNHAANLRKEIAALLDQWIEETAEAILARWVREDRKFPQSGERLDILPQAAELPFSTPQSVSVRPRRADNRRLRATRRSPPAP